ncbi:MAG: chemotaxis protein CheW [Flavobacteriaceae bacterium]
MDDLLNEFLTETAESLDVVDRELVKFEQEPNNARILDNIFRLVHTIKGTCGFLGLPRLEALAHAAETLMGRFRDGQPVTGEAVSVILASLDRIKEILTALGDTGVEPEGGDEDLVATLSGMTDLAASDAATAPQNVRENDLCFQAVERPLDPGEASPDDLELAFRQAAGPETDTHASDAMPAMAENSSAPTGKPLPAAAGAVREDDGHNETGRNEAPNKTQSIRVNVDTLEHLITMVSELVLTRNQLLEIARRNEHGEFKVPLQRLSNVTAELQEGIMHARMQPIGNAWQKLPRIVRDLAQELGKDIELEMHGEDTELDRQVLELIRDPLTHMVRNSADHGLEPADERIAAGKPAKGVIRLRAYHEGGHIIIEVADDGRGLNVSRIREKVLDRGLVTGDDLAKMTESQIHRFIFNAGFSTAAQVTSVSGRGVGMDVVRTNIEVIGGSIDLKSVQGEGTTFIIKIPLTLAIISVLIVAVAGQRFAIPQLSVVELVRANSRSGHRIETINGAPVLRLRNRLLPLARMHDLLRLPARKDAPESDFIVVMRVGSQSFGIVVDSVFHTEEIVVKPMSSRLRDITLFSGNTILGDGTVIMIVDPNGIAQEAGSGESESDGDEEGGAAAARGSDKTAMLLVKAGAGAPKAVPLSLVTRLEDIPVERIEAVNGRSLVQYRGTLMPVIHLNDEVNRRREGAQPLLVFSDAGRSVGLAVDAIIDIVEADLDIEVRSATKGILGSAVINGAATEIIDVAHYLPMGFEDWFEGREMERTAPARRILFVDDSAFFRDMLTPVFKAAGYQVAVCDGAAKALDTLAADTRFDAIVTDIEMPEMNGFELCEAVGASERLRHIPVIALSSHTSAAAIERGRQAGFHDFVAKFDRPGLIASLREIAREIGAAA